MKWLLDHMLVNGINYFVPHAFSMKDFPDPDCPPHFYARGMNPQFPYFKNLMEYCNRVSHFISFNPSAHPYAPNTSHNALPFFLESICARDAASFASA